MVKNKEGFFFCNRPKRVFFCTHHICHVTTVGGSGGSSHRQRHRRSDIAAKRRLTDDDYLPVVDRVLKIGDASAVCQLVWSPDEKYIVCCTETELRAFSVGALCEWVYVYTFTTCRVCVCTRALLRV